MADPWEHDIGPSSNAPKGHGAAPWEMPIGGNGSPAASGEGTFLHPARTDTGEVIISSYPTAIRHGLESVGSGISGAVSGLMHPIESAKSMIALPGQAMQVPAAIRDINQSVDPAGTYAKVAEETAGQGAGEALTAAATPYALKGVGRLAGAATSAATPEVISAPVRYAARSAESAINQKLLPVKPLLKIMQPADSAEAVKIKVPGRDFGLPKPSPAVKPVEAPTPAPQTSPIAISSPPTPSLKGVEPALEEATGATKLKPDVPLKDQLTSKPEHMGQFARANGLELDKALSTADKAKVHALTNVQVRQLAINLGEDMGQDVVGRAKASGAVPRAEVFSRILKNHSPEDIVKAIDQGKHLPPKGTE